MDKRQEELLESIRFLLAEYEDSMEKTNQLVGCKICFIGVNDNHTYKYSFSSEFEADPESSYIDFI